MEAFDPQSVYAAQDFAPQTAAVQRQRKLAELLRLQAEGSPTPQGQMVSGHYVAPSILQHVGNAARQYRAGAADRTAAAGEADFARQIGAAKQAWQSALPQAVAAQMGQDPPQSIGGNMVQGPEYEKTPAQPVTTGQILKHTMAGLFPGNEKAAELYYKTAMGEQTREDTQTFRKEESAALRIARAEEKRDQLLAQTEIARQKSEDARYNTDQQREWRREHDRLYADLKRGDQALKKLVIENKAKETKPQKPLPSAQSKAWIENNGAMRKAQTVLDMLVDETGAVRPEAAKSMNILYKLPYAEDVGQRLDEKGVPLRARLADIGSLKIHSRSGATVTAKEFPRLAPFIPSAGDTPEAAAEKIKNFLLEYQSIQQEIEDYATDMNYLMPGKTATAREGGATGSWDAPLPSGVTVTPRKK